MVERVIKMVFFVVYFMTTMVYSNAPILLVFASVSYFALMLYIKFARKILSETATNQDRL